jgi:CcmE
VKPRTKFLIGGALVIGTAGYLAASAIKDTGVYYLTPGELSAKTRVDPTFYETGVKVGARVVNGSIVRDPGGRQVAFKMTDGAQTYDVVYRGVTPDTFTDGVGPSPARQARHEGGISARSPGGAYAPWRFAPVGPRAETQIAARAVSPVARSSDDRRAGGGANGPRSDLHPYLC